MTCCVALDRLALAAACVHFGVQVLRRFLRGEQRGAGPLGRRPAHRTAAPHRAYVAIHRVIIPCVIHPYVIIPVGSGKFRAIGEGWARALYGGSTGGWESLAVQVEYT